MRYLYVNLHREEPGDSAQKREGGRQSYERLPRGGAMNRLGGAEHCPERVKVGAKRAVGQSIGDDRVRNSKENMAESWLV